MNKTIGSKDEVESSRMVKWNTDNSVSQRGWKTRGNQIYTKLADVVLSANFPIVSTSDDNKIATEGRK